jgi:hypothetical protein
LAAGIFHIYILGYALGLINLGKGCQMSSIKDLQLDERLLRFIEGGKMLDPP